MEKIECPNCFCVFDELEGKCPNCGFDIVDGEIKDYAEIIEDENVRSFYENVTEKEKNLVTQSENYLESLKSNEIAIAISGILWLLFLILSILVPMPLGVVVLLSIVDFIIQVFFMLSVGFAITNSKLIMASKRIEKLEDEIKEIREKISRL